MGLGGLSFARLRPVHVAALSVAYWAVLAAAKLGGALVAIAQVALPGMHGSVGAELTNLVTLQLTVTSGSGATIWTGSTSLPALFAWIAGPPLILAFTARRARELDSVEEPAGAVGAGGAGPRLDPPRPDWQAERSPGAEANRRAKGSNG